MALASWCSKHKKILFIVLLAVVVRVLFLGAESLWLDEGISLYQSGKSFSHLSTQVQEDTQVPLYSTILYGWLQLFPDSEFSIRFPSLIFGVLATVLIFLVGKKLFTTKSAYLASVLFAISPIAVFYAQEARMYSLLVFLVLWSVYVFLNYLEGRKYSLWWLVFINVLILYTHIYGALFILMQTIYILLSKKFSIKWLFSQLATGIIFAPWLLIVVGQLKIVGRNLGWIDVLNMYIFSEYTYAFFGSFVVLAIYLSAYVYKPRIDLFSIVFVLPFFIITILGFFFPLFHLRYVLFTLPFFLLFFAYKLTFIPKVFSYVVIIILLLLTITQGLTLQKDEWRSISGDIIEFDRTTLIHPYYHQEVLSYYVDRDCFYSDDVYGCMTRNYSIISLHDEELFCHKDAKVSNYWPLGFYNPIMYIDVRSHVYDEISCDDFFNNNYKLQDEKIYNEVILKTYKK